MAGIIHKPTILIVQKDPVDREISSYYFRIKRIQYFFKFVGKKLYYLLEDNFRVVLTEDGSEFLSLNDVFQTLIIPSLKNKPYNYTSLNINYRYGVYVEHLRKWFTLFNRQNILLLSFDELKNNPTTLSKRLYEFLNISIPTDPKQLNIGQWNTAPRDDNNKKSSTTGSKSTNINNNTTTTSTIRRAKEASTTTLNKIELVQQQQTATTTRTKTQEQADTCATLFELQNLFAKYNEELYELIEQNPGPSMEQHPFPKFNYQIKDC